MKKVLIPILFIILLSSCTKEYDPVAVSSTTFQVDNLSSSKLYDVIALCYNSDGSVQERNIGDIDITKTSEQAIVANSVSKIKISVKYVSGSLSRKYTYSYITLKQGKNTITYISDATVMCSNP